MSRVIISALIPLECKRKRILFIGLSLIALLLFAATGWCNLSSSVSKYKNKTVSKEEIRKLARYDHLIRYFSDFAYFVPKHKVNPDFIRALIVAESGVDPKAISTKKALGLGQILLSTGQQAGKELFQLKTTFRYVSKAQLNNLNRNDLFDPAINILLTCYLISKYNYKFKGKLDLVVSAWNAGENTQSLAYGQHAPYQETENLIGKINGYFTYLLKNKVFP